MQMTKLKEPSTKYILRDFETFTDENYRHIVNCAHTAYYSENKTLQQYNIIALQNIIVS